VSEPAAPVLTPVVLTVVLPAPATVSAKPVPVMPPLSVNVPPTESMVAPPAPSVIAPLHVLLFARLTNEPVAPAPVPMRVFKGSAIRSPLPPMSISPPLATVVAPATVPSAVLFWTLIIPALTVVKPV